MFKTRIYVMHWIVMLFVAAALAGTADAAPPAWAGGPNKGKSAQARHAGKPDKAAKNRQFGQNYPSGRDRHDGGEGGVDVFFDSRHRDIIRDYYGVEFSRGNCPPGLAKKRNGCLPPGQAKKWRIGYPLPDDVIYYGLPYDLAVRLGYDNPAYKLIRVGADILRIGVGTGIVVEAVQDLGGLF